MKTLLTIAGWETSSLTSVGEQRSSDMSDGPITRDEWLPGEVWDGGAIPVGEEAPSRMPPGLKEGQAWYRLFSVSAPVEGLPGEMAVGRVRIRQLDSPVWSLTTFILQRPGWRSVYEKTMHLGWIEMAEGHRLSVASLPVELGAGADARVSAWRDEARAALGLLAATLDERVAQKELHEDAVVFDGSGSVVGMADFATGIRHFDPTSSVNLDDAAELAGLAELRSDAPSAGLAAARWLLKGVQAGPSPDGVLYLCTAIESLVPPRPGKKSKSFERLAIEDAIRAAGGEPSSVEPEVGRLCGLRADVVHHGLETPDLMIPGFYGLEWIARLLIRAEFGLNLTTWPLSPASDQRPPTIIEVEPRHELRNLVTGAADINDDPRSAL